MENVKNLIKRYHGKFTSHSLDLAAALFFMLSLACDDNEDEISAPLAGKWQSDKADFNINPSGPLPGYTITEDDFSIQMEFTTDGTVVLTDNKGVTTNGTYSMTGRKLMLQIDYDIEFTGLSGTYTVEELTETKLRVAIKKEDTFRDPESGQEFEGEITVTLYFDRLSG